MIVVTSGGAYTDIDAYAGCVAYAELLRMQGEMAEAVLEPVLNVSVTPYLKELPVRYKDHYQGEKDATFVIIDTSEPSTFAPFITSEKVREVIDHHPGFESYWASQSKVKVQIELVGAACTQIFERWMAAEKVSQMSNNIAELLMAGILDNTLGLKAHITQQRDKDAYRRLQELTNDQGRFIEDYFEDCQREVEKDVADSIRNDVKTPHYPGFGELATGQLAVWNGSELTQDHLSEICAGMGESNRWLCNLISISEGKSSLIAKDGEVQRYFSDLLHVTFDSEGVASANRLWLRKEIMKAAIDAFTK